MRAVEYKNFERIHFIVSYDLENLEFGKLKSLDTLSIFNLCVFVLVRRILNYYPTIVYILVKSKYLTVGVLLEVLFCEGVLPDSV